MYEFEKIKVYILISTNSSNKENLMNTEEKLKNISVKLNMGFNVDEISKLNVAFNKVINDLKPLNIDRNTLEAVFYAGAHTIKSQLLKNDSW